MDVDPSEIGKLVPVDLGVVGDAADVLEAVLRAWGEAAAPDLTSWWQDIAGWRSQRCLAFRPNPDRVLPQHALSQLSALLRDHDVVVSTDVGQHQMWAAQYMSFDEPGRGLTSGGLGTMGYGLPAALGAQIAYPDRLVVCVSGEASVQMNIQELATAVQHRLPVKLIILNNGAMGMVRQWQDLIHDRRLSHSRAEALPDFVALAAAYGWSGFRIDDPAELTASLAHALATPGPVLVEIVTAGAENCYPMLPPGAAHHEMLLSDCRDADGLPLDRPRS